ncbi:YggS family pyridoxal phosphate-dependent enzyme [Methanolobus sp.]|jgi:pyridoxal phosphate enzyme (YggS family)|uniref:YggS family pyridoxal phosphate-dependent enzyme n=1 Tax=Methanolobus sp. TaxID=1874737 RepID=UPI0025CD035B|nr:YggS family pyridoxal phosphate-dependent enzyme [Methanolobus sp.]
MSVEANINSILKELKGTKLICVTKTVDPERINEAIRAGATIIGENRIQEFEDKCDYLLPCKKHFIGHLQTNKTKKVVELFDLIQSVDSLKLAHEIDQKAREAGKVLDVYVQINIGSEPQKYGFGLDEIKQTIKKVQTLENIQVTGLMCIPPYVSPEEARLYFRKMKTLFDELQQENAGNINIQELSMGMSGDYQVAIEEGATMVRIGSAIFGDRGY